MVWHYEPMYVDDLADGYILEKNTKDSLINIGSGEEKHIKDFAKFIIKKLKLKIKIKYDKTKPNGTRKKLDTSLAHYYGWKPKIDLNEGFDSLQIIYKKRIIEKFTIL